MGIFQRLSNPLDEHGNEIKTLAELAEALKRAPGKVCTFSPLSSWGSNKNRLTDCVTDVPCSCIDSLGRPVAAKISVSYSTMNPGWYAFFLARSDRLPSTTDPTCLRPYSTRISCEAGKCCTEAWVRDLNNINAAFLQDVLSTGRRTGTIKSPGEVALLKAALPSSLAPSVPTYSTNGKLVGRVCTAALGKDFDELTSDDVYRMVEAIELFQSAAVVLGKALDNIEKGVKFKKDHPGHTLSEMKVNSKHKESVLAEITSSIIGIFRPRFKKPVTQVRCLLLHPFGAFLRRRRGRY
jgi:hypothetical protein